MFVLIEDDKITGAFANPQIDHEDEEGNVTYTTTEIDDDDPRLQAFYDAQEEAMHPKAATKAELMAKLQAFTAEITAQIAALSE